MHLRLFLRFTSIFTFLIGIIFFILPSQAVEFFTDQASLDSSVFIMFLGSSMFGYSAISWTASNITSETAMRPVLIGNTIALIVACPLSVYALASKQLNVAGFVILIIHLGFATGFLYFLKHLPANIQLK